ncbi:MAG: hypothetical protein HYU80_01480 [Candidatus Blackburnbacteria bacterium]|nr:hypothetical protein [Candidatus Blackburnbacteria bacterium]
MTRKTRKQKEKAARRSLNKFSQNSSNNLSSNASLEPVKREFSFSLKNLQQSPLEAKNPKRIEKSILFVNNTAIIQDLVKSAVFAILVLGIELMIYWLWFK